MKIDVVKVAKLANLPLSSEEEEKYSEQLSAILEYVDQLNQVDTLGVEPTFNVTGKSNVMAEDEPIVCLSSEEALLNAPKKKDGPPAGEAGFFVTKGIFDE